MKNFRRQGFSLIELIIVISVIAIISAIIIPSISGTSDAAKLQNAISAAGSLNMAQVQWRIAPKDASGNSLSLSDWPSDPATCYSYLKQYLEYSDADWTTFTKRYSGFYFVFQPVKGSNMQKVILYKGADATGTPISY
jgi:prepilin-type N-terminal cleavage/methylation domain-containing protein